MSVSKFVDRSWQLVGDVERDAYLARLGYALARTDWVLLGYALMSSHVHLVLEAGSSSLGSWTKSVHSRMARWLNIRHVRFGPVLADRPYVEAVDDSRVPYLLAYVHNNPVRARLVKAFHDLDLRVTQPHSMHGSASALAIQTSVAARRRLGKRASARQQAGAHVEVATPRQSADGRGSRLRPTASPSGRQSVGLPSRRTRRPP